MYSGSSKFGVQRREGCGRVGNLQIMPASLSSEMSGGHHP